MKRDGRVVVPFFCAISIFSEFTKIILGFGQAIRQIMKL